MKIKRKIRRVDYLVVIGMPLLATLITIVFKTNQVISLLLFFILPSVYLTIREPKFLRKGLIIILATIPFCFIIDYFAIRDGSWWVYSIFPVRLMNGIPVEDFIWCASWFYYIIIFYEFFIDQYHSQEDAPINKRYKKLIFGWMASLLIFLLLFIHINSYLEIPYFYLVFTVALGIIPLSIALIKKPKFIPKYAKTIAYFFPVNFLHEISALSANQWFFPGNHFIGWVEITRFRFPFEEFILWMLLGASYLLVWYEYFVDDNK
jgi:hypothetical protein